MHRNLGNVEHEIFYDTSSHWSTGTVPRGLGKYLEEIPSKHSIDSLQKTAILGTLYILRKVLQSEA
jgi:hypothetical protein